ncbi:signal transduction histidine kinase [Microbacterium marinum]|uniref:Signal transduction histidine kinase n=1 Tax=Microbacterium marinum TaxID=421115 RepID=A0A7W7FHK2_9MICO|nr:hypothetical protein [Microbacterium marinum]MBB4666142.1 signal transduction histidine kinase [Microbacterium marinum]
MLLGWEHVIVVSTSIGDEARPLLEDPDVARHVADAVNEALINAVKHSAAREATVDISASGSLIQVTVTSPGHLPAVMRSGLGTHELGARITQVDGDVVFRAAIDVDSLAKRHPIA